MSQLSAQQVRALDPCAFLTGADGIDRVRVVAAEELAYLRKMAWS